MALMGWRAGRGLGRGEQGIRAPLIHKRLDRTTGIIVEAEQKQWEEQKKEQVIVLLVCWTKKRGERDDKFFFGQMIYSSLN